MVIVNAIHKLSDWLFEICAVLCTICLTAMVAATGAQILGREYFTPLIWTEELTRYLLVWSTFLGASCVYKKMGHINVTVIRELFPPAVRKTLEIAVHILCGAFFVMAALYGVKYMSLQSQQLSAAMRIPMPYIYIIIPVGCSIMILHTVDLLLRLILPANIQPAPGGGQ